MMPLRWISDAPVSTRNMRSCRQITSTGAPRTIPALPWICIAWSAMANARSATNSLHMKDSTRGRSPASSAARAS